MTCPNGASQASELPPPTEGAAGALMDSPAWGLCWDLGHILSSLPSHESTEITVCH